MPSVFKTKLTLDSETCVLVGSNQQEYEVCVLRAPGHQVLLCFAQWQQFVNDVLLEDTKKICLKHVNVNTFEVFCFNEDGVESKFDENENSYVNRFIVQATYQTFVMQLAVPLFLSKLDVPLNKGTLGESTEQSPPVKKVRVIGCRQDGLVDVIYEWVEEAEKWEALGFKGATWTNICYENHVEGGYTLMFSRFQDIEFTVDVFNFSNVGIGIAGRKAPSDDDEILDLSEDEECELFGDPDERDFYHECRVPHHNHNVLRPFFLCRLKHHNFSQGRLNVDTDMVEEFGLNKYETAKIFFGRQMFSA